MVKPSVPDAVRLILEAVQRRGDAALCGFAKTFDKMSLKPKDLKVSQADFARAEKQVSPAFLKAMREAAKHIERFAKAEKRRIMPSWTEKRGTTRVGQLVRPVDSAGLYIPGGRYPYPSTVLMTAIPARVAGVQRIVMATPPKNLTPEVLVTAAFVGCNAVYRIGGAGAIAAMAYGTKTIKAVDLIVGPGNQYVTEAKRQVFGTVGIDSLAGPSEVVIVADASTPIEFIENDLMAQAEHDPDARSLLLSTDQKVLNAVRKRLDPRMASRIQFRKFRTLKDAFEAANEIGPEHFEILLPNAERYLPWIRHAGAIFLGPASTAVLGDYVAGPSHVLPTQRAARFSSGLSVATFLKRSSVIGFKAHPSERAQWEAALTMGQTEGMDYHSKSLGVRMGR